MQLNVPALASITHAFRIACEMHAARIAVECGSGDLTYAELNERSDRLAQFLVSRGVVPGSLVGVAVAPGAGLIVSLLAVLKAGAGYVPLPAYYPEDRLRQIVADAGLKLVLGASDALISAGLDFVDPGADVSGGSAAAALVDAHPESVAYVMYTSGSTGTPKGVVVPHRAIMRLVIQQDFMTLNADVRILQNSPVAFDAATLEIWGALLNGGTLVFTTEDTSALRGLGAALARHRITTLWLTAGLFHAMADARPGDFAPLRELLTGGDVVSPSKVAQVMAACPELVVINGYGPTENTTFTCCHRITRAEADAGAPLPVGLPVRGTEVHVLDADGDEVGPGVTGELYAAGLGLALGYLGRPDLTADAFVTAKWDKKLVLYRTGDLVRRDLEGVVHYLGRIDTQVKVRGFRVELGEIETAMERFEDVRQAVVVARPGKDGADKTLIGYYVADGSVNDTALAAHLASGLPDYARPARLVAIDALPLNANGKVDRRVLQDRPLPPKVTAEASKVVAGMPGMDARRIEDMIADAMAEALDATDVSRTANFFDLGASSLHVARVHERVQTALDRVFPIADFFLYPSIAALAGHLGGAVPSANKAVAGSAGKGSADARKDADDGLIAIVGLAGRFPGARSADDFWQALVEGRELISRFTEAELDIDPRSSDPGSPYVLARGVMPDADMFDAKHFAIPPREAEKLDPQHRILLEVAQTALENAGHDPERFAGRIGVFAGASQNSYLLNNLLSAPGATRTFATGYPVKDFATLFGNDKDFIATRIAYKLNLRGPAVTVSCACSTSLVAVAQACESLRRGTSDMALAGGVSVTFPSKRPYAYLPDGMASADGHCRTFDAEATGTVFGDGAGLVVLRRLADALADGDQIIAVIRGYSINNDGSEKAGFAAPSIKAQAEVIRAAHLAAGVSPRDIGYVEAHGTATPLGDPIEFAALAAAFGAEGDKGYCRIGSAKTNVGHLDIAAGVTGLIKTALTLKHGVIPPMLHYTAPNKAIDFASSAFSPVAALTDWSRSATPRIAGVSAFGVGGTNIHMVLEEAPPVEDEVAETAPAGLMAFPVSASSAEAVKEAVAGLSAFAGAHPQGSAAKVAETLRHGRKVFGERAVIVAGNMADLAAQAAGFVAKPVTAGRRDKVAFLFPGQGAQHVGMARELYGAEPVFREALNLCATLLEPALGLNLLYIIHAPEDQAEAMTARLKNTAIAQPAIFAIGYALAKQWDYWGITPDVMIGHSIGELAAATIAGVIDLKDALGLIALRGRLMAELPGGVMVSVRASEAEVLPFVGAGLDLAAVNGAKAVVLAGSQEAAAAIIPALEAAGFVTSLLHTSHAFHSHMMEPAVAPFRDAVAKVTLRTPRIPMVSTVTGDWLTEAEATDPDYWASHMRRPVRFFDAVQVLWAEGRHMFLETGPGRTMSVLAGQNPDRKAAQPTIASLPHAQADNRDSARAMTEAFGALWANGYPVDWRRLDGGRPAVARAAGLPTYPFQRKRFWVEPVDLTAVPAAQPAALDAAPVGPAVTADAAPAAPKVSAADALREMLAELSGVDPVDMDGAATFLELGFDSLLLTQATRELSDRFGVAISLRQLIDGLPTIDALAAHIVAHGNLAGAAPADLTPTAEMTRIDAGSVNNDVVTEDQAKSAPSSAPMTRIAREIEDLAPAQRAGIDALTARYTAKTRRSKELTAQYRRFHADPRTASGFNRLWKEIVYQIVTVKSKGSRLIDVDGNEYIDILNGFGPGFLGHSPEHVVAALHDQVDRGFEVGPQSLLAMEAAELFCQVTGNDRASFVCTGSEAVYAAMRLARTVTARDRIVMFARDYHGNFDEVLVRGVDGKDGPRTLPMAPGIPRDAVKNVVVLPYGSPQALDYIRKNAGQIAAVIVEPVQSRRPEFRPHEFIREVRRITEANGALFIFDEVVTGFRFGPRGAQGYYNITADLVTYGKVVGGGMPLGVVSGRAKFMDTFDGGDWGYGDDSFPEAPVTFFAGTFVRHPLVMASLKAMLTFFKSQPDFFWKTVNAKGDKLAGTVDRWFTDNDMPFQMPNCGSLMYLRIGEDQKFGPLLGAHMRDRGVFLLEGFPSYMTAAHDDADIAHVIDAFKDSALEMRAAGLLTGRDAVAHDGPHLHAAPARLSLPGGEAAVAAAMAAPLGTLTVPTTEAQREIWAAMIVTPEVAPAYNESVTLKLRGAVDADALIAAARDCFARHDALRSTFSEDGSEMLVHPVMAVSVALVDLTVVSDREREATLRQMLADEADKPFDMVHGPFVRAHLVALAPDLHHLIITAHHIVCDGWSIDVMMRDIGALYTARLDHRMPDLGTPLSIIDYARAEAEWSLTEAAAAARSYWLGQFKGTVPVLDLPVDKPRPVTRSVRGARLDRALPPDLVDRLRKLARVKGSTFVNLLLAAYKVYIARIAETSTVVIGLPSSGQAARNMPTVVGHCVNLLPIRTEIDWTAGFDSYLGTVRRAMLDAFDHQTYTYGELIRELRIPRDPTRVMLVPVIFNIDNGIDLSTMSFGSAETEFVTNPRSYEHFELYLNVTDAGAQVHTEWSYGADLFSEAAIAGHIDRFVLLLRQLAETPDRPMGQIPLLSGDERRALLEDRQGRVVDYPREATLATLFADRVAANPEAVALIEGGQQLRFGQLDAMAGAIADQLAAVGVGAGDIVGICLDRSARMVAAMLAAMRLGAAYAPLDPSNPADRLRYIAEDSRAKAVVTTPPLADRFGFANPVFPDAVLDGARPVAAVSPRTPVKADVAYIAYTSGSTGKPKGVMGTHRAAINRFSWMWREFPFTPGEVMCQKTAISFVDSIWEIFGPLLAGVPQVIIPNETVREPKAFLESLARHGVTRLLVVPSLLKSILDAGIDLTAAAPSLRLLFTSGERIPATLAQRMLTAAPQTTLVNLYGSSEVAADVTCEIVRDIVTDEVPIGHPIDNARIYVLDGGGQLVPPGEAGELFVGGEVLAAGYLHRPDLTAERFVPDRFAGVPGALMFATGDRVRALADGRLMYLGRTDQQVKIRGSRVELGEVEAVLGQQDGVAEAVVLARPDADGDLALIAYATMRDDAVAGGRTGDGQVLRAALARALPDYMVPQRIMLLDRMPLNPNGKTDRAALAARRSDDAAEGPRTTWPVTVTERDLHEIWSRLLDQPDIGVEDDFFELGGHSLLAVKLFTRIRRKFGVDLPISTLFAHPTIRSLARRIATTSDASGEISFAGPPEDSPWDTTAVIAAGPGNDAAALFIVGGVGGNVNNLVDLGKALGQHRPVIGLQTRGVLGHRMHDTVEAMAADHLVNIRRHQPVGPYHLAGYSGGAVTAFEMARQLETAGEKVTFVGVLDMFAPGFEVNLSLPLRRRLAAEARALAEHGAGAFAKRLLPRLRETLLTDGMVSLAASVMPERFRVIQLSRHWWRVTDAYKVGHFGGDLSLYLTEDEGFTAQRMREADPDFGWGKLVGGRLRVSHLKADHFNMLEGEAVLELARRIEADIRRSSAVSGGLAGPAFGAMVGAS